MKRFMALPLPADFPAPQRPGHRFTELPVAIVAVTAGPRHSNLAGGQQDARMLFENLARTNAFLDTVAQTPPTP